MGLHGGVETSKRVCRFEGIEVGLHGGLETSKESVGLKQLKWVCMEGWRLLKGL